jgi:outer membrane protein OmpA-like peptidoglycan-associated protein/tetratricopeptide (TPR) repeat protein
MMIQKYTKIVCSIPSSFNSLMLIILLVVVSASHSIAQNTCTGTESKKARKSYDKAMEALRNRKSGMAEGLLMEALEADEEYADALWRLGQMYFNRQQGPEAEKYLLQLVALCPDYNAEAYLLLGKIYYGREDYNKSVPYFETFLKDPDKIKSDTDYDHGTYLLEQAEFLGRILQQSVPFAPYKVLEISTEDDEYLVTISPDGEFAFFTRRSKAGAGTGASWSQGGYRELFMQAAKTGDHFEKGYPMPPPFNVTGNEGGATVTARNDELYFTICSNVKTGNTVYNNCDIYYSKLVYDAWTPIEKLSPEINGETSWESQPSVTADGKTLYFASDRKGGFGGSDLYIVRKDDQNLWGEPVNLGPVINTGGNEKTPFIHTDSQTLYFSSSDRVEDDGSFFPGHRGLGGYDIFFSRAKGGAWGKPVNIGFPINSESDDLGFFVSTDGATGYFSSNKIKGSGGYDLYAFDLYPEARPLKVLFIKGTVSDNMQEPLSETKIELKNTVTNEIQEVEIDTVSGRYVATTIFDFDYILTVKKPEHIYQSRYIAKDSTQFQAPVNMDIEMEKVETGKSYELHDIYFATNSSDLSRNSLYILNEFIGFLTDNPKIKADIQGHTDDVGDEAFNLDLSERRAKAVYDYLISQGVSSGRLSYQGFGESRPVEENTTDEGRAKNRRTEFVITSK